LNLSPGSGSPPEGSRFRRVAPIPAVAVSRPWRRRASLSVRRLIIRVRVVGAWLGWLVRSARIQREAAAAIRNPATWSIIVAIEDDDQAAFPRAKGRARLPQNRKAGKLTISPSGVVVTFPIAQSATKVTTRTSRSIDSPALAGLFDHSLRTLTDEPCTSHESIAY
jgi:hypothetical protein